MKKPAAEEEDDLEDVLKNIDKILKQTAAPITGFALSTGISPLDWAISIDEGGIRGGSFVEIYGEPHTGKSNLAISLCRQAQLQGGLAAYFDTETSFDESWAQDLGLCVTSKRQWYLRSPDNLEATLSSIEKLAKARVNADTPTVIVWDSIAQTSVKDASIDECDYENITREPAREARKISTFFRRGILRKIAGTKVILIGINHAKEKIGGRSFVKQFTTPGGTAIHFGAHIRLRVSVAKPIEDSKKRRVGHFMQVQVTKNKRDSGGRTAVMPFYKVSGIDNTMSMINLLLMANIIRKEGLKYKWRGEIWTKAEIRERCLNEGDLRTALTDEAREAFRQNYL